MGPGSWVPRMSPGSLVPGPGPHFSGMSFNLLNRDSNTGVSCEYCEMYKRTPFVAASVISSRTLFFFLIVSKGNGFNEKNEIILFADF